MSELSLLEELQAYPACSSAFSVGGNISTNHFGHHIDQDIVDSFLNFPEECELHTPLGPVLADHADHNELLESWMLESGFYQSLLDAVVPDHSYSYLDDAVTLSTGLNLSTNSSQTLYPYKFGIFTPATDSLNGNVDTMMESLLSSDQNDKLSSNTQQKEASNGSKRRRAKPGGNNQKSRPRDRQRIQDRVKELRVLVPNGAKCSIDGLLDKTVKHMLYLTSVTDQAQLLKKWVNHSLKVDQHKTRMLSESKDCPIHVEDLAHPGHLLIEVLCNERVLFLEIAHVIRSLELNILKGFIMQSRDNSDTWAHFVVEASRGFQRLDIFWPLMQLLHRTRNLISTKI